MKAATIRFLTYCLIGGGVFAWMLVPIVIMRPTPFFISWIAFAMWIVAFVSIKMASDSDVWWLFLTCVLMLIIGVIGYFVALKYWDSLNTILGYWIPGFEIAIALSALVIVLLRKNSK